MRLSMLCLAPLVFSVLPSATAEEKSAELPPALKSFVNEQTLAVVGIDLARLDLAALQKQYLEPLARTDADRNALSVAVGRLQEWSKRLQADGSRQIYLVTTTERLQVPLPIREMDRKEIDVLAQTTFLVLPKIAEQTREDLRKALAEAQMTTFQGYKFYSFGPKLFEVKDATIIAFEEMTDLIKTIRPAARKELASAWNAAGDSPLQFAVVAPPIFSRAAEEILLEPLTGMKQPMGPILARGLKWAAFGVEPNLDRFNTRLTIQSADAEAANQLSALVNHSAALVSKRLVEDGQYQDLLKVAMLQSLLPQPAGDQLVAKLDEKRALELRGFTQAAFSVAMAKTYRYQSMNNLKQIALAFQNYEDKKKQQPDRTIRDNNGKPLLSWRVAILPEIEGKKLYDQFHLDEPWDSEHNRKLIEKMPETYQNPDTAHLHPGRTRYLVPIGEKLAFPPDRAISLKDFTDGTSKTIQIVEADRDHAVIWTKPDDLEVNLDDPKRGLTDGKKPINAATADGAAHVFPGEIEKETLRRLFTRNGGEPVNW